MKPLEGNPEDDIKEMSHRKPGNKVIKKRAKRGTSKTKRAAAKRVASQPRGTMSRLKHGKSSFPGKSRLGGHKGRSIRRG